MEKQLQDFIEQSKRILITSHISPDPDAVCSMLLLGTTLSKNFPDKQIESVLEEQPAQSVSFLEGYDKISFGPITESLKKLNPELLIIVDANSYDRCSRTQGPQISDYVTSNNLKTIIIDHHEPAGAAQADLFINNMAPACTQEIYTLLFDKLRLQKPEGYAQTSMLGIIGDTSRFKYKNPDHRKTFAIASELIDAGASIEELENRLERYSADQMLILGHLASNAVDSKQGYSYSFISDEFSDSWRKNGKQIAELKNGYDIFVNSYVRNIGANKWGFAVYRDMSFDGAEYGVSFRSLGGVKDVSVIAAALGGGGHKPAAGAKFQAKNVQEAIEKVKNAIGQTGAVDES